MLAKIRAGNLPGFPCVPLLEFTLNLSFPLPHFHTHLPVSLSLFSPLFPFFSPPAPATLSLPHSVFPHCVVQAGFEPVLTSLPQPPERQGSQV